MLAALILAAVTLALLAWIMLPPLLRARRRARLAAQPLSAAQCRLLADNLPQHLTLPPEMQARLERRVQVFLAEKRFLGCGGLAVTDAMRMAVAAQACLLCLRAQASCFPAVREILLYPGGFWVRHDAPDDAGLVDAAPDLLAGEAWQSGRVILSWDAVAAALAGDDTNVVAHEFAHQLDFEAPGSEGAPVLADYGDWSRVFASEYQRLRAAGSVVIDSYGAQSPAEFFAVATEAYFQRPLELAAAHHELYAALQGFYRLDTARS